MKKYWSLERVYNRSSIQLQANKKMVGEEKGHAFLLEGMRFRDPDRMNTMTIGQSGQ